MYGLERISGTGKANHSVVILHGILQIRDDLAEPFGMTLAEFGKQAFDLYVYGYDHTQHLTTNGVHLADALESINSDRVDLVGYSMGGLVARLAASDRMNPNLQRIVTIATPNRGALGPAQLTLLGQIARQTFHFFSALAPRTAGVKDLTQAAKIMKARRERMKVEYPLGDTPVSSLTYASIPALFYNPNRTDFDFGPSIQLSGTQMLFLATRLKWSLEKMERPHDGIVTEDSCQINNKASHDWSELHFAVAGPNGEPPFCHAVLDVFSDHDHSSIIRSGATECAELVWLLLSTADWSCLEQNEEFKTRARFDTS